MRKIANIVLGCWFWVTNRNNKIAQSRLANCSVCLARKGMLCGKCGCVLQAKARLIEEECPLGLWPKYYTWDKSL